MLPPNWNRYTTDEGKEYFHNAVTNTTQWDRPEWPETTDLLSTETSTADVFTYQPTTAELEVAAKTVDTSGSGSTAVGSSTSAFDELMSLNAPSGSITAPAPGAAKGGVANGAGGAEQQGEAPAEAGLFPGSGWLLETAQKLFDVTTEDVVQRLQMAMVPFKEPASSVKEEFDNRPDFYGPFWIATTVVLFLAATGNFARLVQHGDHTTFRADYSLVSVAASMVYGSLVAVPAIARVCIFVAGEDVAHLNFARLICVCGYSLAPVIPASLLCLVPAAFLRWLFTFGALAISLFFLRQHLLSQFNFQTPWLKWTMLAGPCLLPTSVLLVYRVHFF